MGTNKKVTGRGKQFIKMHYHFRGQGFKEALVTTKFYTPVSISMFLNKLLYLTIDHYKEAEAHLRKAVDSLGV